MFTSLIAVSTVALTALSALAIPASHDNAALVHRGVKPPKGWPTNELENYYVYHARYTKLDCENKHSDKSFFDTCCVPMLKNQKLSSRPAECDPYKHAPSPTKSEPKPTAHEPKPTGYPGGGPFISGGVATYFYQNGVAGACGKVHPDSARIAAIDSKRWGNSDRVSDLCGREIFIRNVKSGKSVTVVVADECPTCNNANCLDLSLGAFKEIGTEEEGEVEIEWRLV
jgi:hypothetical protein